MDMNTNEYDLHEILFEGIENEDSSSVKVSINKGCNPNLTHPITGISPLLYAIKKAIWS
jgi:hypothetical protein